MCLTEEDSGMLMSSVFIVIICVGGKEGIKGQWGLGSGTKNRAVDCEHGASKGQRFHSYEQKATIPSKRIIQTLNIYKIPHIRKLFDIYVSCCMEKESTCRLKINHATEKQSVFGGQWKVRRSGPFSLFLYLYTHARVVSSYCTVYKVKRCYQTTAFM